MEVHVGQRGEIVIPKNLRERLGIEPNMTLHLSTSGNRIELHLRSIAERVTDWNQRIEGMPKFTVDPRILALEPYEDEDEKLSSTVR